MKSRKTCLMNHSNGAPAKIISYFLDVDVVSNFNLMFTAFWWKCGFIKIDNFCLLLIFKEQFNFCWTNFKVGWHCDKGGSYFFNIFVKIAYSNN